MSSSVPRTKLIAFLLTPDTMIASISSFSFVGSFEMDSKNGSEWNTCFLQSMDNTLTSSPSCTETSSLSFVPKAATLIGLPGLGIQLLFIR